MKFFYIIKCNIPNRINYIIQSLCEIFDDIICVLTLGFLISNIQMYWLSFICKKELTKTHQN